jgi:hypothetical protein
MKNIIFAIAISAIALAACNSGNSNSDEANKMTDSPTLNEASTSGADIKSTSPINAILISYLKMKNAFAKDNDKDAATAGNEMVKAFASFNAALLTAEKKKTFNDIRDDAKEHAEHIGMNAGNIKHQREHFDMLSKDMYDLVKAFGAGQTLYVDHCPMYNDNKGATWLSETKEIKNPYFGKEMDTCGTIKEELK